MKVALNLIEGQEMRRAFRLNIGAVLIPIFVGPAPRGNPGRLFLFRLQSHAQIVHSIAGRKGRSHAVW